MKRIAPEENSDWATMECSNGHQFDVDPHTEENLVLTKYGRVLVAQCPVCFETDCKHSSLMGPVDHPDNQSIWECLDCRTVIVKDYEEKPCPTCGEIRDEVVKVEYFKVPPGQRVAADCTNGMRFEPDPELQPRKLTRWERFLNWIEDLCLS